MTTILILAVIIVPILYIWRTNVLNRRREFIDRFTFDLSVQRRIAETYPHLTPTQIQLLLEGLRDYFRFSLKASAMLSMPSQAVDEAWHAFILSTKAYDSFCQRAFGKFLHHHPAETMTSPTQPTQGIKRIWNLACQKEGINASKPQRLPRLFAIDSELKIPNGFVYSLNCLAAGVVADSFCSSHIGGGCGGSGCGGGDSSGDSSCGGGCGGGD